MENLEQAKEFVTAHEHVNALYFTADGHYHVRQFKPRVTKGDKTPDTKFYSRLDALKKGIPKQVIVATFTRDEILSGNANIPEETDKKTAKK